ncbi:hypothetical protein EVAR_59937_1 [Eumeta japonica]|uniref:Uncharacterized protein n=1 Tax=Eumeta variegata TaxID=151549 RepID=A0A4C1ZG24_EUMVA|nr:hypothetical protein EVAR_59937_1 [Eumeta japonica]
MYEANVANVYTESGRKERTRREIVPGPFPERRRCRRGIFRSRGYSPSRARGGVNLAHIQIGLSGDNPRGIWELTGDRGRSMPQVNCRGRDLTFRLHHQTPKITYGESTSQDNSNKLKHD